MKILIALFALDNVFDHHWKKKYKDSIFLA